MNPEDLLTRTLGEVADRADHPATPVATVAGRAARLRARRRRTTALAVAAVVAAVAAPTALRLGGGHGSPEPTRRPSPAVVTARQSVTALRALPRGPRASVDYVAGDTYVGVGGGRSPLPRDAVSAVPAQGGGMLVSSLLTSRPSPAFQSGTVGRISVADRSVGPAQSIGCGAQRFAVSPDRTETAYWLMDACRPSAGGHLHAGPLSTMGNADTPGTPTPPGYLASPVGFVRTGVVANRFPTSGTDVSADGVWVLGSGPAHLVPGLRYAAAVSEAGPSGDLVAGQLRSGGSGVVALGSGHVLWTAAPTWSLGSFSLDGRYVVARSTAGEGDALEILDAATGRLVTRVPSVRGTDVLGESWGEDGSLVVLLATASGAQGPPANGVSALVRCTVDGRLTRATPVARNAPHRLFYSLGTNP